MSKDWTYQYKHPKWQKKRLEALNNADFTCQCCFDSDTELHVHHKRYVKGRKIWEYDISELDVLCDNCHKTAHDAKDKINIVLVNIPTEMWGDAANLLVACYSRSLSLALFMEKLLNKLDDEEFVILEYYLGDVIAGRKPFILPSQAFSDEVKK